MSGWQYDEFVQSGVNLDDAQTVAEYVARQGSKPAAEIELIAAPGIQPGDTVVDLGCGTGSFAHPPL